MATYNESELLANHVVDVISPRSSLAVSTSIGPSVLPVSNMCFRTSSAPSLMLYSKNSITKSQRNQGTFQDGIGSSPVVTRHQWIATIHLWNGAATSVFVASQRHDCIRKKKVQSILHQMPFEGDYCNRNFNSHILRSEARFILHRKTDKG